MKKFYVLLLLCAFGFVGKAQLLFNDDFTGYTVGSNLAGQNSWTKGGTGPDVTVQNTTPLTYPGYNGGGAEYVAMPAGAASSSKVYKSFTTTASGTNTFYYSVLINLSAVTATGDYFLSLGDPGTNTAYFGRLFAKASGAGFNLGISKLTNVATANFGSTVFNLNQTYLVVVRYSFVTGASNDEVYLWVNPSLSSEPLTSAAEASNLTAGDPTLSGGNVGNFLWHNRTVNNPTGSFDGVRVAVGATSSDAWTALAAGTSSVPATPTVTSISPTSATAGGSAFTLTVNGTNFVSGASTVTWNGSNRTTTFVSSTQLTASIPASDIASAGTANVGVTTTGAAASSNTVVFTINGAATPALSATTLTAFGNVCTNTTAGPNSFTITGTNLTAADITVGPLAGYSFSTTSGGTYTSSLTLSQTGGSYSQQVFVKFTPTAVQSYNGNIPVSGGGASPINVAASGAGINTAPTVTTGSATSITTTGATLPGTITDAGCGTISAYGIEYSTTNGFANGTGTQVPASNLSSGNFSVSPSTLAPSTTYYFKAYATNGGGTSYGAQQSFTTSAAPPAGAPVATAATGITSTGFTANWNAVSGATGYRLDVYTSGGGSSTSTIAGWNFLTNTAASQTADAGNANNIGIQQINPVGTTGAISYPGGPTNTSGANPNSVSTTGWDNGAGTKYWQIDVNTTGATGITVSSMQGGSNTGPKDFKIQYKVGASGTWTDVPGGTVSLTTAVAAGNAATWVAVTDLPLPSDADNQALVSVRWIVTSTTSVNGGTVSSAGTSRISAIYVKGTTGGGSPVYVAGYQNLPVGNVTSYNVTGLTPNTTYYYVVRAENGSGTSANSNEITVTTSSSPSLSANTLTAFGNICTNTTAGPNSFTITGTNLSTADVTVGPLAGYTFSTTSGGTYTSSLTLNQPGGSYSQQVFVKFTPTAVQSYNGNIPVSGGGATSINVAASGAGVNTAPSVTTGAASSITTTSATAAGSIPSIGCSAITAYGIEYSTTNGFANGSGTQVPSSNLSGGNFSSSLSPLAPGTTYYYKAYATNAGGTTYGTQQSFTTVSVTPTITTTALTGFGNICTNTTAGPNSFTITGTNLTTADITVGPLAGYSFSTTSGGTYTSSLTLNQGGGSYSQQVFVKFTPTAVQSYNGNIPVSGGGAPSTNVAAAGSGVNTAPSVTTGTSSGVTSSSTTLAGTIGATGCTAVTAYGIEYSTTNGFANGSGTQVASTNLVGGAFSSNVSGLAPSTTYYYKAYATNGGGTSYGAQQSFTTSAPPPASLSATTLAAFGSSCPGVTSAANSFTITGTNLVAGNITVGPLAGYTFATTANGTYTNSLTIPTTAGAFSQQVFVKFTPTSATSFNGNIPVSGGGATPINVAASGSGVNTPPAVTTGSASNITTSSAVVSGNVTAAGCSNTTDYGIEYSGINNFVGGTGTKVSAGTSITTGAYSVNLTGLVQGATYYYRAYATSAGGTTYGGLQSFTVAAIPNAFTVFPVPVQRGHNLYFSMNNLKPGFYGISLINSAGQEVYKKGFNIQVNFINDHITVPYTIPDGVYRVRIYNTTDLIDLKTILVKE